MRRFSTFFLHLGLLGPLILGILDSSFLFLPFGNDLLLVVLIASDHRHLIGYVLTATAGSTIGVFLLDLVCRTGGEDLLRKMIKPKRYDYLENQMKRRAGIAIAVACIAPPPFPFTPVIAAASAFEYPRRRELGIVLSARLVRYTLLGLAALLLGQQILGIVRSSPFYWSMVGFIVLCAIGSGFSVYGWIKRARRQRS